MRKSFPATIALALVAYLALPMPGLSSSLQDRIDQARNRVEGKRAKEGVLTTELTRYRTRIQSLQGDISDLQARQNRVQADLDSKQAELTQIADRRQVVLDRLVRLRKKLADGKELLSTQLVALYKDQQPDMVTVVLEAHGFTDLLDRAEYIDRVSSQNEDIVTRVRDLSREVARDEARLADLEAAAKNARDSILAKRNEIDGAKQTLISRQGELKDVQATRANALGRVRSVRVRYEKHLHVLEAKQAEIQARLSGTSGTVQAGPIRRGSGQFIWPVNGSISSGFGTRWGRLHAGVDIPAPVGTPIRAAASGTVAVLQSEASSGGYGNYTCIQHGGAISTCYGHQSRFATSSGAHVSQGQVIGYTGNTGNSTGPHLHFEVRVNGSPVDPLQYF